MLVDEFVDSMYRYVSYCMFVKRPVLQGPSADWVLPFTFSWFFVMVLVGVVDVADDLAIVQEVCLFSMQHGYTPCL